MSAAFSLSERQANDLHVIALLGMQGHGPAGSPDEIGGVGRDDEG